VDVNGDGLLDWIVANGDYEATYLNTGKGWCVNYESASAKSWRNTYANAHVPNCTQAGTPATQGCEYGPPWELNGGTYSKIIDVNGDGAPDWIVANGGYEATYINTAKDGMPQSKTWCINYESASAKAWRIQHANADLFSCIQPSGTFCDSCEYGPPWEIIRGSYSQLVDLNKDGLPDWIVANQLYEATYLNTGKGWCINYESASAKSARIVWANAHVPNCTQAVGTAASTGLSDGSNYGPPWEIIWGTWAVGSRGEYSQLVDVNGDGLPDWIVANAGYEATYLNTGKGWCVNYESASAKSWRIANANAHVPNCTHAVGTAATPGFCKGCEYGPPWEIIEGEYSQLVDLNKDGLLDWIVAVDTTEHAAYLNTGKGWCVNYESASAKSWRVANANAHVPNCTQAVCDGCNFEPPWEVSGGDGTPYSQLVDVNGDGLPDWIVANAQYEATYLNTGKGWCVNYESASAKSWRVDYANAVLPSCI
jgi:hypothetical protein